MAKVFAGLDVGSTNCELVAMDAAGVVLARQRFGTTEKNLIAVFEQLPGEVHVHLEASELADWVRRVLKPRVARVVVSHPKSNLWIGRDPLKDDRIDAWKLADMLRTGRVHEVFYAETADRAEFKRLVQHYDKVTEQEAGLKRAIKTRLRARGVILRGDIFQPEDRPQVLSMVTDTLARSAIEQLYELLEAALKAQRAARRLLAKEARRYPEIELFEEVPGVGLIGACRFSAYVQTPFRFAKKRRLWRYCRLGIAWRKSDGKPLNHQALDSNGCERLKDMSRKSFMAAMACKETNAFQRTYRGCLARTADKNHARLTVQRKIITTLWTLWKKGEHYRDNIAG